MPCARDHVGFIGGLLAVEELEGNAGILQLLGENFAVFDGAGADQHGPSRGVHLLDVLDRGAPFAGGVDEISRRQGVPPRRAAAQSVVLAKIPSGFPWPFPSFRIACRTCGKYRCRVIRCRRCEECRLCSRFSLTSRIWCKPSLQFRSGQSLLRCSIDQHDFAVGGDVVDVPGQQQQGLQRPLDVDPDQDRCSRSRALPAVSSCDFSLPDRVKL